jgi:hypothetical protein
MTPTVTELSQVISQVAAPAFLLGAVVSLISVLISRMAQVVDRACTLDALDDDTDTTAKLKSDIPRLKRRAELLNKAVFFSTISAITTSLIIIFAFVSASFNIEYVYGVGILFILSVGFFTTALVNLAREIRMSLKDSDYFGI